MIDFTNKCIVTENNVESEQLLKKAIAQGFNLPKGEKAMESHRYFRFIGSPYKHVVALVPVCTSDLNNAIRYSEIFGNELEELKKITDSAARWCRAYGMYMQTKSLKVILERQSQRQQTTSYSVLMLK